MEIRKIQELIVKSIKMFRKEAPKVDYNTHITKSMLDAGIHRSIFINMGGLKNSKVEVGELLPPVWQPIFVNLWLENGTIQGKITLPGFNISIKPSNWNDEKDLYRNIIVEEAQFFYSAS